MVDLKGRKAVKYGLVAGTVIAAMCSLPMALSLLISKFTPSYYFQDGTYATIAWVTMLLGNLALTCAPLSLPVAAITGFIALRSARAAIVSLNDAVAVNFVASLLMALTGAFGAFLIMGAAVYSSNGLGSSYLLFMALGAPAFAIVLLTISFFGGLVYSVYALKLSYVRQSPGQ